MIPRHLHFIWLGTRQMPTQGVRNMLAFQRANPMADVWLWDDAAMAGLDFPEKELLLAEPNQGARSDILRLVLLRQFGGVYFDFDIRPQRALWTNGADPNWWPPTAELVGCQMSHPEGWTRFANAFLACVPQHPAVCRLLARLPAQLAEHSDWEIPERTGPGFVDEGLKAWRAEGGALVELPECSLFPYGFWETDPAIVQREYPDAFAIHESWKTWL